MSTNKFMLLVAAVILSGLLCAMSAMAGVESPSDQAWKKLTAIESMSDGQAPKFSHGIEELSGREGRFHERLPMQLSGPMGKISKASYKPSQKRR